MRASRIANQQPTNTIPIAFIKQQSLTITNKNHHQSTIASYGLWLNVTKFQRVNICKHPNNGNYSFILGCSLEICPPTMSLLCVVGHTPISTCGHVPQLPWCICLHTVHKFRKHLTHSVFIVTALSASSSGKTMVTRCSPNPPDHIGVWNEICGWLWVSFPPVCGI